LKSEILAFKHLHPDYGIDPTPEVAGVDVTQTLKTVGIVLEWPPVRIARQVALGYLTALPCGDRISIRGNKASSGTSYPRQTLCPECVNADEVKDSPKSKTEVQA
jgi:hypothetical protein